MMRKLFLSSTLVFWLAVAGFWAADLILSPAEAEVTVAATDAKYSAEETARHNNADDCWMIIDGQVYDLSAYVPQHPSDPAIFTPWCGKEATEAYRTKTKGRPHSPYADSLLPEFQIGALQ